MGCKFALAVSFSDCGRRHRRNGKPLYKRRYPDVALDNAHAVSATRRLYNVATMLSVYVAICASSKFQVAGPTPT